MRVMIHGGTGQAKVAKPILIRDGHSVPFVFDKNTECVTPFECSFIHSEEELEEAMRSCDGFLVCIGGVHGAERERLSLHYMTRKLAPLSAIHSTAHVSASSKIERGCQIMTRAVIGEEVSVGQFCIINTNATVDHECRIGAGVHIMGGAALAGLIEVGDYASIGTNATVLPRIKIGKGAVIGAGAVVTKDVPAGAIYAGVPARELLKAAV